MKDTRLSRRGLLAGFGSAAVLGGLPRTGSTSEKPAGFSFVFLTDSHIQPELDAADGVKKAVAAIRALPDKPAFGLVGGDLVMDATHVEPKRAALVYDLWQQSSADLTLPLHYSMGNHDLYALGETGKPGQDPDYGKGMWKRRLALDRTYHSFDHGGWRFVVLDSAQISPDGNWTGALDAAQIKWLDDLLRQTPRTMPMVFVTHFPVFTIFGQYTGESTSGLSADMVMANGRIFKEMIQKHNVRAVFQGHTHVVEECIYAGVHYITGGAICGNWWKGPRLGVDPEGFVVATVTGDDLTWRYVPYGWKARPAPAA
jgi:3',5'-cyclic AMP phosphodiesterase CpdA